MSRRLSPHAFLGCLSTLLFLTLALASAGRRASPKECLNVDVEELENYLSELNLREVPSTRAMIGGFKCPVTALPFGALKSDWARISLLRDAQPVQSGLREKLDRLLRILVVAYFQMEESFDATMPPTVERVASTNWNSWTTGKEDSTGVINAASIRQQPGNFSTNSGYHDKRTSPLGQETFPLESTEATSRSDSFARDTLNKIRKPQISRKSPRRNGFWKYRPIPGKVLSSTLPSARQADGDGDGDGKAFREGESLSRGRGNLGTNVEKILRWFYGLHSGSSSMGNNATTTKVGTKIDCKNSNGKVSCCN